MSKQNNISFLLDEDEEINLAENDSNFDMNSFLEQIEEEQDLMLPNIIHYTENFTVKELLVICDYYGIKANKSKKEIIIQVLTNFETNYENYEIVSKRKTLWFYINELKNDKFMKKFLLW
jgi:hypothetical protein